MDEIKLDDASAYNWAIAPVPTATATAQALSDVLNSGLSIRVNSSANIGTRTTLNFIQGVGLTISGADDVAEGEVEITLSARDGEALTWAMRYI